MASIGVKYPVWAPLTETDSSASYGSGVVLGKAIGISTSIEVADVKLYGDDDVAEEDKSFDGGSLSLNSTHLTQENRALILGHTIQSANIPGHPEIMEVISKDGDEPPYGGFGYYGSEKTNGQLKYHAYWLPKTKFSEPNTELETKGETTSFQTPTIEGEIYRDITGAWKHDIVCDSEVQAKAWLNEKANIGEPADLEALDAKIDEAELLSAEDYTSESWVAVANALSYAVEVSTTAGVSQSRVDAALSDLTLAMAALIERT